jgi:hypothetical protein
MSRRSVFAEWLATPDPDLAVEAPPTAANLPLLVVGAGPAGLAGMDALAKHGIDFVGIDSHRQLGGMWDISNPISSAYEGLCTVTSRFTTYLGAPMPNDWPDFIPHEMVLGHLAGFAESRGLLGKIKFGTSFVDARKSPAGTWLARLRSADGGRGFEQEFRGIVFATGAHNQQQSLLPPVLSAQARVAGLEVLHSSQFKNAAPFSGKRVLIVGLGDSAADIAPKVCSTAKRTLLSVRTSPWLIPQVVMGVPVDQLGVETPEWLPWWFRKSSFRVIRWRQLGGYRRLGMTRPKHGFHDKMTIIDRGIIGAIRAGRVAMRSHVVGLAGGTATFADPRHEPEPVDMVLFATGFGRAYPLLCGPGASVDEVAGALSFRVFHPSEPGLFYLAETVGLRCCWPIFTEQANTIAAYLLCEHRHRPNVRRFNARRTVATPNMKGVLFRLADQFHLDYEVFTRSLRDLARWFEA